MKFKYLFFLASISFILNAQENFNLSQLAHVPLDVEANDIWGFVDENDREYAIIGTIRDTRIFSLDDPSNPVLVSTISGTTSIWRDIKSYKNYLYVVADQGSDGVVIINMAGAPNNITSKKLNLPSVGSNVINRCHNLYIDTESGIMFLAGCNNNDGVLAFDLKNDPENPVFINEISTNYAHDVFVQDQFVYASEFSEGQIAIYDITDIGDPALLGSAKTTSFATHNAWADDANNYVYTTDETTEGALDAFDITDKSNPRLVDAFIPSSIKGRGFVPHNTHYLNDYLITSWYTYGLVITDVSRPEKIIETGHFDTHMGFGDGAWGAYPYLPSGLILVSDITNGLFILQPEYKRAAYLEGRITDADTGLPIPNATIKIISDSPNNETSDPTGAYVTGQLEEGTFTVIFDHPMYEPESRSITMVTGETSTLDVELTQSLVFIQNFSVTDINTAKGIPGANIRLVNEELEYDLTAFANGTATGQIIQGEYLLITGAWGYDYEVSTINIQSNSSLEIQLFEKYADDFIFDYKWTETHPNERSKWVRVKPTGTYYIGQVSNPENDLADDLGDLCYVTGNGPGGAGQYDVDAGQSILYSPVMDLLGETDPTLSFYAWFFNDGGSGTPPNDQFEIFATNGSDTVSLILIESNTNGWQLFDGIILNDFLELTNQVQIIFETGDDADGHLVEAGVDGFSITTSTPSSSNEADYWEKNWQIISNPVQTNLAVKGSRDAIDVQCAVFDMSGKKIADLSHIDSYLEGDIIRSDVSTLSGGNYILLIQESGRWVQAIKWSKI